MEFGNMKKMIPKLNKNEDKIENQSDQANKLRRDFRSMSFEELYQCHRELCDYILLQSKKESHKSNDEFLKCENLTLLKSNQDLREIVHELCSKLNKNSKQKLQSAEQQTVNVFKNHAELFQKKEERQNLLKESFLAENNTQEIKILKKSNAFLEEQIGLLKKQHLKDLEALKVEDKINMINDLWTKLNEKTQESIKSHEKVIYFEEINKNINLLVESKSEELKCYEQKFLQMQTKFVQTSNEFLQLQEKKKTDDNLYKGSFDELAELRQKTSNLENKNAEYSSELISKREILEKLSNNNEELKILTQNQKTEIIQLTSKNKNMDEKIKEYEKEIKIQTDHSISQTKYFQNQMSELKMESERKKLENDRLKEILNQIENYFFGEVSIIPGNNLLERLKFKIMNRQSERDIQIDESKVISNSIGQINNQNQPISSKIQNEEDENGPFSFFRSRHNLNIGVQTSKRNSIRTETDRYGQTTERDITGNKPKLSSNANEEQGRVQISEFQRLQELNYKYKNEIEELKKKINLIDFGDLQKNNFDVFSNSKVVEFNRYLDQKISEKDSEVKQCSEEVEIIKNKIQNLKRENRQLGEEMSELILRNHESVSNLKNLNEQVSEFHKNIFS